MRTRTLADRVSMGLESAPLSGTDDAGSAATRDRMGPCQRIASLFRGGGRCPGRVWPLAMGCRARTSHGAVPSRGLCPARERHPALSGGVKPVVERSPARKCVHATGRLPRLPHGLSALCSAGAVPGIRGQRRSCPARQCRAPSLACACASGAQADPARTDPLGGCGRSSASPHLDEPLASAICGDPSLGSNPAQDCASSSPTSCHPFSSPLELAGPARPQCLVGTTTTACHYRWRSHLSDDQVTREELATSRSFFNAALSPSLVDQQGGDPVSASHPTCLSSPEVF